jgi:hypothetical protein
VSQLFSAFGAAFVGIGFLCAPIAALVTLAIYLSSAPPGGPALSIAAGLLAGILSAVGIGMLYQRGFQTASAAYPEQFRSLMQRLRTARERLRVFQPVQPTGLEAVAVNDALTLEKEVTELLEKPRAGAAWISAMGYLQAWNGLHRLEESLIFLLPPQQVVAMARDDVSRLNGSTIPDATGLKCRLQTDIELLQSAADRTTARLPTWLRRSEPNGLSARADFALIHNAINSSREDQWAELVGARNSTMLAAAIAGLLAYLGLVSVVAWPISRQPLLVATSFVVTGALVSLLHQVTLVGSSKTAVEDFGHWHQTFNWTLNRCGYFWAALFGFTPSLLFQLLQSRVDSIKSSLDSSRATGAVVGKT